MNEPIIETCDLHHKYYKEAGSQTRCPFCLAIGLQAARAENERLIDEAHLEVRATYDSTVAQAWREKLTASEAERIHARQILVEICNIVGACTADVSLTFLAHLPGEVKMQLEKERQTAVDLFDVVVEIAQLMGIERSEPEICRKTVAAVRQLKKELALARDDCQFLTRAHSEVGRRYDAAYAVLRTVPEMTDSSVMSATVEAVLSEMARVEFDEVES